MTINLIVEIINVFLSIIIVILSFTYSFISYDKHRKMEKFILGANYIVISILLLYRITERECQPYIEYNIIITLFNLVMLGNLIDSFAGLKKMFPDILREIKFKLRR